MGLCLAAPRIVSRQTQRCTVPLSTPSTSAVVASCMRLSQRDGGPGCLPRGFPSWNGAKTRGSQPRSPAGDDRRRLETSTVSGQKAAWAEEARTERLEDLPRLRLASRLDAHGPGEEAPRRPGLSGLLCRLSLLLSRRRQGAWRPVRALALQSGRPSLDPPAVSSPSRSVASSSPSRTWDQHRLCLPREYLIRI